MSGQLLDALRVLPDRLAQHVLLCASALGLALALGLPLALLCARAPRLRRMALAFAALVQTIPGLALMALFYPILLAFSALTRRTIGASVPALGFLPALLALALYALLPILRNGVVGLMSIDPAIREAADGLGMTERQRLFRIEAPLAAVVVMGGIRTATVWTIGAATLATSVGQTSLGNYIFSGLQTEDWISVLVGCVAAAILAIIADLILALAEGGVAKRDRRRFMLACLLTGAGVLAALAGEMRSSAPGGAYVIGAKNFSEQFVLADLMTLRLRRTGAEARIRDDLGSAVAFRALRANDIDAYVDYSGTLWTNVLKRNDRPARATMLAELGETLRRSYGVRSLGALGFENAYVLAMRSDRAAALGIRSIADLAAAAPRLTLGADLEFLARPEWRALRDAYGLSFRATRSYDPTLVYRALESGEADVVTAFSSDGRILADRLTVLADPRHALPDYDAVILLAPKRAQDRVLVDALSPLVGKIDVCRMREANLEVDRANDKLSPAEAARRLDVDLSSAMPRPPCPG